MHDYSGKGENSNTYKEKYEVLPFHPPEITIINTFCYVPFLPPFFLSHLLSLPLSFPI
jgi:hypothetical protein